MKWIVRPHQVQATVVLNLEETNGKVKVKILYLGRCMIESDPMMI